MLYRDIKKAYAALNGEEAAADVPLGVYAATAHYLQNFTEVTEVSQKDFPYINQTVATVLEVMRLTRGGEFARFGIGR